MLILHKIYIIVTFVLHDQLRHHYMHVMHNYMKVTYLLHACNEIDYKRYKYKRKYMIVHVITCIKEITYKLHTNYVQLT